jgi:hypothetical protein
MPGTCTHWELRCPNCLRFLGEMTGGADGLRIRCTNQDCRCWVRFYTVEDVALVATHDDRRRR